MNTIRVVNRASVEPLESRRLFSVSAYTVTDLGAMQPWGISPQGDVVGAAPDAAGRAHPTLYTGGRFVDLGTFGGKEGYAVQINRTGEIVGSAQDVNGSARPFLYSNGVLQELPVLPGGTQGYATGINDAGAVIGFSQDARGNSHWGILSPVEQVIGTGSPRDVNNRGDVVGVLDDGTGFLYSGGHLTPLGAPNEIRPNAINDAGEIVGGSAGPFAYLNGEYINLGTLGGPSGTATDVNASGVIVGSAQIYQPLLNPASHAFVYDANVMRDLNTLIDPTLGLTLERAVAINASGQIVAVGNRRAVLLTPSRAGSISGALWNDHNGDGIRQSGDGPLAGAVVYIDANGDGYRDAGDVYTVADSAGRYRFDHMAPGPYAIRYDAPQGWDPTLPPVPDGIRTFTLNPGQVLTGQDIAYRHTLLYRVVDLGTLGGATSSAAAVNDVGQVVGSADTGVVLPDGTPVSHAFEYDVASGGRLDLGTLGGPSSYASSINNLGQIAGSSDAAAPGAPGGIATHAFVRSGGKMLDLGDDGWSGSFAAAINDAGQVVGTLFDVATGSPRGRVAGFLYSGGQFSTPFYTPGASTNAVAINNAGQLVLTVLNNNGVPHTYRVTGTDFAAIGPMPYPDSHANAGEAINDSGMVAGTSDNHPFVFTDHFQPLPTIPGGSSVAMPNGINNAGWVVGDLDLDDHGSFARTDAFLNVGGRMRDLNNLIVPGTGWTLSHAYDINNRNWIVGQGTNAKGQQHGFLLLPVAGSISGNVYADWNGDGTRQPAEWNQPGVTVYLDANHDGHYTPGDPYTATDAKGNFAFTNLPVGAYDVGEIPPNGWRQTTPASSGLLHVDLDVGDSAVAGALGVTPLAFIGGTVFLDRNANGVQDAGEAGLANWRVFLDLNNDGKQESNEPSALTDAAGHYAFRAAPFGTYAIREVPSAGLHPTIPAGGSRLVLISSGQVLTGADFGNR